MSYNYNGKQNVLYNNEMTFKPKAIYVFHMQDSIRTQSEKQKMRPKTLKEIRKTLSESKTNEMEFFKNWINKEVDNIIFDSSIDDWNKGTSEFHSKVLKKKNLYFLIENIDGVKYGIYK